MYQNLVSKLAGNSLVKAFAKIVKATENDVTAFRALTSKQKAKDLIVVSLIGLFVGLWLAAIAGLALLGLAKGAELVIASVQQQGHISFDGNSEHMIFSGENDPLIALGVEWSEQGDGLLTVTQSVYCNGRDPVKEVKNVEKNIPLNILFSDRLISSAVRNARTGDVTFYTATKGQMFRHQVQVCPPQ